jgi:hypothetical protein
MIRAEVDFICERELGGGNAEVVGLGRLLENFVVTRIFDLKREFAAGFGPGVGSVEREGADVDGLAGLIDGLLGREQDGGLVLQLDSLRELGRADGSVSDVADLEVAG